MAWADKFRFEQTASATAPTSWMLDLFRRTRALRALTYPFAELNKAFSNFHIALPGRLKAVAKGGLPSRTVDAVWLVSNPQPGSSAVWAMDVLFLRWVVLFLHLNAAATES